MERQRECVIGWGKGPKGMEGESGRKSVRERWCEGEWGSKIWIGSERKSGMEGWREREREGE